MRPGSRRVHWGAPWGSQGSSGVAICICVRQEGHPGPLGSYGCALGAVGFIRNRLRVVAVIALVVVGFIQCRWVHCGASRGSSGLTGIARLIGVRPGGRRIHPGSLGCALVVAGFIWGRWVHWGMPWESSRSSGNVGFIGVRLGGRRDHPWTLGCALGFVGFVRGRWGYWSASWGSTGSSGVACFIGVRPVGSRVPSETLG